MVKGKSRDQNDPLKTTKGANLIFAPFFRYIDMQYVNKTNTSWTFDCNVFDAVGSVNLIVYNTNDRTTQEFTKGTAQYTYENNTISFTEVVALEEGVRYEFRVESNDKRLVYAAVTVEGDASIFNSPSTIEEVTFV